MNRAMLLDHLRLAEAHVQSGERHIALLRRRIAELETGNLDARLEQARALLDTLLHSQALHIDHRDRLRVDLTVADAGETG